LPEGGCGTAMPQSACCAGKQGRSATLPTTKAAVKLRQASSSPRILKILAEGRQGESSKRPSTNILSAGRDRHPVARVPWSISINAVTDGQPG